MPVATVRVREAWGRLPHPLIQMFVGWGSTVAILVMVALQLRQHSLATLFALVPVRPLFWLALIASYFAVPVSEWLIFRRLWAVGAGAVVPLLRKQIWNALIFSYAGDACFFAWARRALAPRFSAFHAVRDVAILSALVNNGATILLVAVAWPFAASLGIALPGTVALLPLVAIVLVPVVALASGGMVLRLSVGECRYVLVAHLARTIASILLVALAWHYALPSVALSAWLVLSGARMVLSRLPVPNRDIALVGCAAMLFGGDGQVTATVATVTTLTIALHAGVALTIMIANRRSARTLGELPVA